MEVRLLDIEGLANVQRIVMATIAARSVTSDGGPGSGNHNHAGRPGQVGGSQPGGGKSNTAIISGPSAEASGSFYLDEKLRPKNDTYEDGDTYEEWQRANLRGRDNPNRIALSKIYDEGGHEAVIQEYFNFKLEKNTKDLHQISEDEAHEVIYDNMSQSTYDGWIREANSAYKPRIVNAIVSSPEMRNATLNLMYENYKYFHPDTKMSFEEFLETPVTMFRGGRGQKHVDDDVFSSYTFDKKIADKFAGENGKTYEAKIRPIDTYGSLNTTGESEILVPSVLAPNGNVDNSDLSGDGGPGSGNWGHTSMNRVGSKGGGSDPGGGRHMRLEKQMQPDGHYPWSEYHQREQKYTGLVWAYRANEVYKKSGEEAAAKFMGVSPESFSKKVGKKENLPAGTSSTVEQNAAQDAIQKIREKMKAENRIQPTADEFVSIGKYISDEVVPNVERANAEVDRLNEYLADLEFEEREYLHKYGADYVFNEDGTLNKYETYKNMADAPPFAKKDELIKAKVEFQKALEKSKRVESDSIEAELKKIRSFGLGDIKPERVAKEDNENNILETERVREAMGFYPTDWIKKTFSKEGLDRKPINVLKAERGYFDEDGWNIAISPNKGCEHHEIGHLFENAVGLVQYEKEYYDRRTAGEELKQIPGYEPDEKGRADDFLDPYFGKDYGGDGYELLAAGFELLKTNPAMLRRNDPEMYNWCLGILAMGG